MNFQPDLAAKVMAGEKTVTRRLCSPNPRSPWYAERCALKPGKSYAVAPGRGKHQIGRIRVLSVRKEPLGNVSDAEAQLEGFGSSLEFEAAWRHINASYEPRDQVWRIEFYVDPKIVGHATSIDGEHLTLFQSPFDPWPVAFDYEGGGPYVLIVGCPNCRKHADEWWHPFAYVGALNSGRNPNEFCSRACRYQLEWQAELAAKKLTEPASGDGSRTS